MLFYCACDASYSGYDVLEDFLIEADNEDDAYDKAFDVLRDWWSPDVPDERDDTDDSQIISFFNGTIEYFGETLYVDEVTPAEAIDRFLEQ